MAWDEAPPTKQELTQSSQSWDSAPPTPQELSQQDQNLGSRILSGAKNDIQSMANVVSRTGKGIMDLPSDLYQTGTQLMGGGSFNSTPIGQDIQTVGGAVNNAPGAILRQFQEIGAEPLKYIPGEMGNQFKQAYPENPFVEHPVNTAMALLPLAKPMGSALSDIPKVGPAVESAGESIAQPLRGMAQNFGRRALGLSKRFLNKTEGQLPAANQSAQTALDTGVIRNPILHPFSSGADDMLQRANALDQSVGSQIGDFLKSQGESFDPYAAMQKLEELKAKLPPDDAIANQIGNAQDLIAKTNDKFGGNIPFDEANKLKSYLQNKVNWNSDKASAQVGQKVAGSVRGAIDNQLEGIAKEGGTGPDFQDFLQNKKMFGDAQIMQKGLLNKTAGESGNLPVSPYSLITGITEFVHTGNPIKALMIAGGTELAKRYGSATAATMTNSLANLFSGNPSKYSTLLQTAIQTGGATLDAVTEALQKDPDFQQVAQQGQKSSPKPLFQKPAPIVPKKAAELPPQQQEQPKKYLDEKTARMYLDKSNGNKEQARAMATQDGWVVV